MTLIATLARVDADLAAGRLPVARQRLRGLVSSHPQNLLLRRRLAEVYRLYGEPAEAGRWMYLEADRDPAETSAFEARYSTPPRRMRALAWNGPEALAGTDFAARQLAAVRQATSDAFGVPVEWDQVPFSSGPGTGPEDERTPLGESLAFVGMVLMVLGFFAVWVLGFITFVRWVWQ
ncbi:DUF6584 family protein [Streptomyces sp. NBC_00038]|uniref:DUF6584 family protein n=1 Tax=Streptomyces sp. NBC_00038 TaxID=2903615 RepID=UPI00224E52D1|nr:DUF6584 family protein [Streptomyces sp. NBC_00038]MCX5558802.1 hypothetical protein [Streptomyces sp. NBC_00038]